MENTDTSLTYDLYAMIRHTTNYRFQNLFLFTEIQSKKDTLEIILSEKNGKWRGKGFGDVKELKIKIYHLENLFNKLKRYTLLKKYLMNLIQ